MAHSETLKEYDTLVEELNKHARLYYVEDNPGISDEEYDRLYRKLLDIEKRFPEIIKPYSPSQRVGDKPLEGFKKIERKEKMLSLDNVFSEQEFNDFDRRVRDLLGEGESVEYVVEYKIDGLGIELYYENGLLATAATRGDGLTGEDVTANIRTIKSVPLRLNLTQKDSPDVVVRGEVYIEKNDLLLVNREREREGEPLFKNCRNAAAGSVRLLDPRLTAGRPLRVLFYHLIDGLDKDETHYDSLRRLKKMGLPTGSYAKICKSAEEFLDLAKKLEKTREALPLDIDGLVIKVNSYKQQKKLGNTAKYPRWAVACKFTAKQATTKIVDIKIQVGRTGVLTPVAEFEPVLLSGSTIARATLHNEDEIKKKDIRIGDTALVQKAGEVIPQVIEVLKDLRSGKEKPFRMPEKCPVCGGNVKREEGEVALRCVNGLSCEAQLKESIRYFATRRAMDIERLGPSLVDQLVDSGLIRNVSDIYRITGEDLLKLERFGEKSAENVVEGIRQSRGKATLPRTITALGIQFVGEIAAQAIAGHFASLDSVLKKDPDSLFDELQEIDGIGPRIAASFRDFLKNTKNRKVIEKLIDAGINPKNRPSPGSSSKLEGLSFCITGTLPKPREDIRNEIIGAGGTSDSSIKKSTNYLIVGDDTGEKKLADAKKYNVKVITYPEFQNMLSNKK